MLFVCTLNIQKWLTINKPKMYHAAIRLVLCLSPCSNLYKSL